MKWRYELLLTLAALWWAREARAQLELGPSAGTESVFCGAGRIVPVMFHNPVKHSINAEVRIRLYQSTSTTAVFLTERPWKKLIVPPDETVAESAPLDFPPVRGETTFVVQWIENANRVTGSSIVKVFPTNLLEELEPLAGKLPIGIYDPSNHLKPALRGTHLQMTDISESPMMDFPGELAIVDAGTNMELARRVHALAKNGKAIVWIQEQNPNPDKLPCSFFTLMENRGAVIAARPDLVPDLAGDPQSQLHLIQLCRLALHPAPPAWPDEIR